MKPTELLAIYLHLARASQLRRRALVRVRLLVLAGSLAVRMGLPRIAAYCRQQILECSPNHLVARWPNLAQAQDQEDFLYLLRHLQRRYSAENSERLLQDLGIQVANERASYFSEEEYAAALLGIDLATLDSKFGASNETA